MQRYIRHTSHEFESNHHMSHYVGALRRESENNQVAGFITPPISIYLDNMKTLIRQSSLDQKEKGNIEMT